MASPIKGSSPVKGLGTDLNAVLSVARKDLLLELRSKEVTIATLFFSGLVLVILAFALGPNEAALRNASAGVLWVALAFAGVISASQSYQSELEEGALEQLLLYPVPRATLFLGKLLANWLFMLALGVLLLPVSAAVFGAALGTALGSNFLWLLLTVALGTLGFSLIATFYAALTANLRARESLLPVLIFPIIVPVILASVRASSEVMLLGNPAEGRSWVQLLAGFDLVYLVVCTAIFPFVVEE